jgi:hypothetical protein
MDDILCHGATVCDAMVAFFRQLPRPFQVRPTSMGDTSMALKATIVRTEDNPSKRQVMDDPRMQEKWLPVMHKFIQDGRKSDIHHFATQEEIDRGNIRQIPHVDVFDTKRKDPNDPDADARLKFRMAADGSVERPEEFAPDSITSVTVDTMTIKAVIAFAAANDLVLSTADAKDAFPTQNKWDSPHCKNPRLVGTWLSALESGTGRRELLVFDTCTNGLRDASREWEDKYAEAIMECGFVRCAINREQYYWNDGQGGFMSVSVVVDDMLKARSRNQAGSEMNERLKAILTAKGIVMVDKELDDLGKIELAC